MYYVYVLWSKDDAKYYVGYTANLERRIDEHNTGKVYSTSRYSDEKLLFYEAFVSKEDAMRRERYFKTTKGKKSLGLILRNSRTI